MSKTILNEQDRDLKVNVHTTKAAHKRLKQRYGKEKRFRLMGLLAVLVSAVFLAFLLVSIFIHAMPVIYQHKLTLEVPLKAEEIDPEGKRTPISVSTANYGGLIKEWLRDKFPGATGRRDKKALYGLVSSNAGGAIQQKVMANPSLVGQPLKVDVLLSDYADLYFKGTIARKTNIATNGIGSPVGTQGEVRVLSTSNDFRNILAEVKEGLAKQLTQIKRDVEGQQRILARLDAIKTNLEKALPDSGGDRKAQLEKQLEQVGHDEDAAKLRIETLNTQLDNLQKRVNAPDRPEQLGRDISSYLIAINGGMIKVKSVSTAEVVGEAILPLKDETEQPKGNWQIIKISPPESERKLSDKEVIWLDKLAAEGRVQSKFNDQFFSHGASREAEVAGIWGAVVGTFYTMLVTLLLSFPIGVSAAIYLEEFAPKNKITDLIEVNINNLAAVPSIVFGLLGLAMFLNIFGMPRSAPVVGGMVLALMTLPTIIIASRAAIKAVPPSIKEAALGIGASHMQAVFHHTLPLAMPGILTGSIIGMAQALGETAPLLMIGMVAFIVDIPGNTGFVNGFTDPATVLPVQIYMWADFPEKLFQQKTAAAIVVLLAFLIAMNALAVLLRKKFERRW